MSSNLSSNSALSRIEQLLDENSFVELGAYVTSRSTDFDMNAKQTPSDGVVIGHGLIDGNLVFVFSQDPTVLGGSIGEMHAKKIASIYDMAVKMGAPVIGLVDSTGIRLQESVDSLEAVASIYAKAVDASGVVPQLIGVLGNCGGGLSILASISDFTFMTKDAKLFVNSPDTIPGNRTEVCDTASAEFAAASGNVDFVGDEAEVYAQMRQLITLLPGSNLEDGRVEECTDDLNRAAEVADKISNPEAFAKEISDMGVIFSSKSAFAEEMYTGLIKLNGITVGVVGNAVGELTADGAEKAADFVSFCDAFDIPVISLVNTTGYASTVETEKRLARSLAKLSFAFANASVPKISLITAKAVGTSYIFMNAKSLGADLVYAYADAEVAPMDADLAAKILDVDAASFAETQCGVTNAARRGYIDRIIESADTRKYLIAGMEMLFTKRVDGPFKKHGTK